MPIPVLELTLYIIIARIFISTVFSAGNSWLVINGGWPSGLGR